MAVSEQIIQVLDALCEKFGLVIDWTSTNVIPYMTTLFEKLVKYEIWTSVAWMIFMIPVAVISIKYLKWFCKMIVDHDDEFFDDLWLVFSVVGLLASIICVIAQTMDIIKCVTFPEMFVFEYVQRLMSNGG